MSVQQVVFYSTNSIFEDQANVSLCVREGGEWVKLGVGVFDKKNRTITTNLDKTTPEGKKLFEAIQTNKLKGLAIQKSIREFEGEHLE